MHETILYHGSNVEVCTPQIITNGYYKDFGYGFYCTNLKKQAEKWAIAKKGKSIVNEYIYDTYNGCSVGLRKISFSLTNEWLDFIVSCRQGIKHDFDIVEGPMADDKIWSFVESFTAGEISRSAFWELAKFSHPTHQIAFCTERSLQKISFKGSEEI